ncbi:MAG: restriction endonuclease subunit S [Bacteroidaceae bacterium]|nr:restriction endonuclease subunit S [Bacteroidaceae bacterium]
MEWKECKIGDIGKIVTGKTPRTSIKENYGGTIPFLSPSDDMSYKSSPVTARTLTELGLKEVKNCLVPTDSICVSCIGSDLGKVVKASTPLVTNQQINTIIPFNSVDSDFIYYLMTIVGKELNFLSKTSTAVPIVNKSTFSNYDIRIPKNKKDQHRIASILSSLDRKIELNNKINAQLEEMAQALFKSWFVDFKPFKDGKFVESELGMIPEGWRVVSLADLMDYAGGSQPPASEFIDEPKDGYIRFIQIRDYETDAHVTYIPISKRNKLCHEYDIMIARYGAALGRICMGLSGAYNVALAKVFPKKAYFREYLRSYLKSDYFYKTINNKGARCAQSGFNKSDIRSYRLAFPTDEDIVKKYELSAISLIKEQQQLNTQSLHLSQLRDTLLPKLMNGEIEL